MIKIHLNEKIMLNVKQLNYQTPLNNRGIRAAKKTLTHNNH